MQWSRVPSISWPIYDHVRAHTKKSSHHYSLGLQHETVITILSLGTFAVLPWNSRNGWTLWGIMKLFWQRSRCVLVPGLWGTTSMLQISIVQKNHLDSKMTGEIHWGKVCVTQVSCNPAARGDRGFLRSCDGRKMQMKWSVVWHPVNGTWCSLTGSRISIRDTRIHCQFLPSDRTICKILNFWELFSSERVATQLKVLHKQHMLDVWCAELVSSTQSSKIA